MVEYVYLYDYLVFIGRFQIIHLGHIKVVHEGLKHSRKIILAVGSCGLARTIRNPLTFDERVAMWKVCGDPEVEQAIKDGRIIFVGVPDSPYMEQQWIKKLTELVDTAISKDQPVLNPYITHNGNEPALNPNFKANPKIGLLGCKKDNSSYYLSLFPQWPDVAVPQEGMYHSTAIRNSFFEEGPGGETYEALIQTYTSEGIKNLLEDFSKTPAYEEIKEEYKWVVAYKESWAGTPYPVIFNTVDCVAVQSGHVLVVKRGAQPGKGKWALPGGYINPDESLEQAMLRELREETKINMTDTALKGCITKSKTFDDPNRSARGRVITHAFLLELPSKRNFPKVKGSDDAVHAKWIPLKSIDPQIMFEDHWAVIMSLTADI